MVRNKKAEVATIVFVALALLIVSAGVLFLEGGITGLASYTVTASYTDIYLTAAVHNSVNRTEVFVLDATYYLADMKAADKGFYLNFTQNLTNGTVLKIFARQSNGVAVGIYDQADTLGTTPLGTFIVTSGTGDWYNTTLNIATPTNAIWLGEGTGSGIDPKEEFDYIYASVPLVTATDLVINLTDYYGLNSSLGKIDSFNTTNLEEIEYMELNFTLNSSGGNITNWYLNFTANGTNGCSLGNKQSSVCYNFDNDTYKWIQFIENIDTLTYDGTQGNQGDRIIPIVSGLGTTNVNISLRIDEHYNPNVFKWYDALYNFSDVKWQTGADQRITKNNFIKIEMRGLVPLDADQYKLDFRVQCSATQPTQPLSAYGCNSTYTTGDPSLSPFCSLIAQKSCAEFQDDGTKFRAIFTKNFVDQLGDGKYVILSSDESNPNRYYSIKTYKATAPAYTTHWNYSINSGTTWVNLGDGYETELNFNWFYNGVNPTAFVYNFWANTSIGTESNLMGNVTWSIDATQNYPPLADLIKPEMNETISIPYNVTFTVVDPNDDNLNASLLLYQGGVLNKTLITDMNSSNTSYYWTAFQAAGVYNLTLSVCELGTTELYCVNNTHQYIVVEVDNSPYWSNNQTNIVQVYSPSILSYFNITWQDDNNITSVWLESNYSGSAQNYSMNNVVGDIYDYSAILPAGNYYWKSYANDTADQWNETDAWPFTIAKAITSLTLTVSPGWTVLNGTQTNVSCYADNNEVNATLYRNESLIGGSVGGIISDVSILGVGDYNYTCNNSVSQNYTFGSESNILKVSLKNPASCSLSFDPVSGQTYPVSVAASCSCTNPETTAQLYRNGTNVTATENGIATNLAAGDYAYVCNASETASYASASNSSTYIINKAATVLTLTSNPSWSETFGTSTTVNCLANNAEVTPLLYVNGTNVAIPYVITHEVGTYNYTCNATASQNYSFAEESNILTINQATSVLSLSASPGWTVTPGTQTNVSCSADNNEVNISLYRNSTYINSSMGGTVSDVQANLSLGTYFYICNNTATQNYTSASSSNTLTISEYVPPTPPSGGGGGTYRPIVPIPVEEVVEELIEIEVEEEIIEEEVVEKAPEVEKPTLLFENLLNQIKSGYNKYFGAVKEGLSILKAKRTAYSAIITNLIVLLIFNLILIILVKKVLEERKESMEKDVKFFKKKFEIKGLEDKYIVLGIKRKKRKKKKK